MGAKCLFDKMISFGGNLPSSRITGRYCASAVKLFWVTSILRPLIPFVCVCSSSSFHHMGSWGWTLDLSGLTASVYSLSQLSGSLTLWIFSFMYVCVLHSCSTWGGQKLSCDWRVVSCHVLCKSNQWVFLITVLSLFSLLSVWNSLYIFDITFLYVCIPHILTDSICWVYALLNVLFFWFSHFYWGPTGKGPLSSAGVFTGSSATPGLGPEGPGGGWAHRACFHYLVQGLGSCRVLPGWSWKNTWCRGWLWA